jgi:predicted DsbA family dithiol-disulfide isomerase
MQVDIWSDVICPWCYLGKARFSKALSSFAHHDEVEVVYRSFELDPGYPKNQHETTFAMLSRKYGMSEADARAAESRIAGLAAAEGLDFAPERPVGNTFDIHRVLHLGLAKGVQADLVSALDRAYFGQGEQVFDRGAITGIAVEAGLDGALAEEVIDGDGYAEEVRQDELLARQLGITGVPFIAIDMALGVSGAQSAEAFASALQQAWERHR